MLRDRSLRALLAAEVISTTGSQMTWLALPWFVYVTTGSATRMTLVVGAELVGLGLLGLPGGKVLGRLGAWRSMVVFDGLRAPIMLLIPVLHWAGGLTLAALVAVAFALGALSAPYFAAQRMIVPELIGEEESLVSRAMALFQGAQRVTLLLGPILAGVLISVLSAPAVLVVDAATFAVAAVLVAGFVSRRDRPRRTGEEPGIREGLRFMARERLLRIWIPVFSIGDAAWMAFFVSIPVLVVARFDADPRVAGWLLASFGVGAVVGNLVAYRLLLERVRGLSVIAVFVMGQALPLWLLAGTFPAAVFAAALGLSGLANGLINPSIHALMTLRIPPALRPTVMTANMTCFALVQPLGVFGAGPVLDAFGPRPVLVGLAAVQTVAMLTIALTAYRARAEPTGITAAGETG